MEERQTVAECRTLSCWTFACCNAALPSRRSPPAECKVQGFTIEDLEPQMNFRRPWTLGYDPKIESKMHVLPYMRGNQDVSLRSR